MRDRFGLEPEMIESSGGRFEVRYEGELIFSKETLGRFPNPDEVESALADRL